MLSPLFKGSSEVLLPLPLPFLLPFSFSPGLRRTTFARIKGINRVSKKPYKNYGALVFVHGDLDDLIRGLLVSTVNVLQVVKLDFSLSTLANVIPQEDITFLHYLLTLAGYLRLVLELHRQHQITSPSSFPRRHEYFFILTKWIVLGLHYSDKKRDTLSTHIHRHTLHYASPRIWGGGGRCNVIHWHGHYH